MLAGVRRLEWVVYAKPVRRIIFGRVEAPSILFVWEQIDTK